MLIIDETSYALLSGIVGGFAQVDRFTPASTLSRAFDIWFNLGFRFVLRSAREICLSLASALRRVFPNYS